ncbi:MAG: sugar ABC transporter permease [Chloroflexi bacterium]|nr:sugar ABC transporter permease [Chloroflexota bacterium]
MATQSKVQSAARVAIRTRRHGLRRSQREALTGLLWISPWLVGFVVFTAGPMGFSLATSFTQFTLGKTATFIGVGNYVRAFTGDPLFWPSLGRTLAFTVITVPLLICGSLGVALLMNQALRFTSAFRTLMFLPFLTPVVAAALLWRWVFQPDWGPVNDLIFRVFHVQGPQWIYSEQLVIPSLAIIVAWTGVGGARMIIFLAGLQNVPTELYEAAEIDGAGVWSRFWNVTIPMISPTIFLNVILAIIASFTVFELAFIATDGGPNYASWFFALHIYANAFRFYDMGYGTALAWILFALMAGLTFAQFRFARHWVYYASEQN